MSVVSKLTLFQFIVRKDVMLSSEINGGSRESSSGSNSGSGVDGNEDIYIEALHAMEEEYQRNLLMQYQVHGNNNDEDAGSIDKEERHSNIINDDGHHNNIITSSSSSSATAASTIITIDDNKKQVDEAVFLQSYIPTSLNDISNPQEEMYRLQTGQREQLYASTISSMLGTQPPLPKQVGVTIDGGGPGSHNSQSNKRNDGNTNDDKVMGKDSNDNDANDEDEKNDTDDNSNDESSDDDDDDSDDNSDAGEDGRYRKVPLPEHELQEMRYVMQLTSIL